MRERPSEDPYLRLLYADGGSPGLPAGLEVAAADRFFTSISERDFGLLLPSSRHRNDEIGAWDLEVLSRR